MDEMSKLTETVVNSTQSVELHLKASDLTAKRSQRLLEVLKQYPGKSSVFLHITKDNEYQSVLEFKKSLQVMACEPLQFHLDRLFEKKVVKFNQGVAFDQKHGT